MAGIPFSGHYTASLDRPNNRHRVKQYRKFIGKDLSSVKSLDIGAPNYVGQHLGLKDNTRGDLNKAVNAPSQEYDVVCCFEVINHVMNPLLLVQGIHSLLKDGGTLYLTTPLLWFTTWYHGRGNFAEYKRDRLDQLFKYAGFEIVRYEVHNPWPWFFIFYGFRPPFRFLLNRYQIWEMRKK